MTTETIQTNNTFTVDVTVRESDIYSKQVLLKFENNFGPGHVYRTDEIFVSPDQLAHIGRFFIQKANEIRSEQEAR